MKNKPNSLIKLVLPWVLLLLLCFASFTMLNPSTSKELTYTEFNQVLTSNKITEAKIEPSNLVVDISGKYQEGDKTYNFSVSVPNTEAEISKIQEIFTQQGIDFIVRDTSGDGTFLNVILSFLPTLLLLGVMFYMMTKLSGAGGNAKAFEFGNSRAKLEKNQNTRFSDVAGADEEKRRINRIS